MPTHGDRGEAIGAWLFHPFDHVLLGTLNARSGGKKDRPAYVFTWKNFKMYDGRDIVSEVFPDKGIEG